MRVYARACAGQRLMMSCILLSVALPTPVAPFHLPPLSQGLDSEPAVLRILLSPLP